MAAFTKRKIGCPHSLGEKLTRARKRKSLELREVERETKVAFKYLQALEHGQYDQLPVSIYARGFLGRYAKLLGLNPVTLLAEYEHERTCFAHAKRTAKSKPAQEGVLRPSVTDAWLKHPNRLLVTPGVLWGGVISVFLVGVLTYMWFQVASFAAAPPLEVVTPGSAIKVTVEQIEVAGVTDPSAQITINNQPVAVDTDGHFRQEVQLVDGINTIEIAAVNKAEKQTLKTLQLMADLPKAPVVAPAQPVVNPTPPATSEGIKE
jgi:cytoskeletal protein RodZ